MLPSWNGAYSDSPEFGEFVLLPNLDTAGQWSGYSWAERSMQHSGPLSGAQGWSQADPQSSLHRPTLESVRRGLVIL
jgi:hypothetical protein